MGYRIYSKTAVLLGRYNWYTTLDYLPRSSPTESYDMVWVTVNVFVGCVNI